MHVKLIVSGKTAELYIDNNEAPVMFMHDLKREIKPGLVGVKTLPFSAGHFANFSGEDLAAKEKHEPGNSAR